MADHKDELLKLSAETKELSDYIVRLKRKKNKLEEGPAKDELINEIKMRQFQALFYIEKMENLSKENKS